MLQEVEIIQTTQSRTWYVGNRVVTVTKLTDVCYRAVIVEMNRYEEPVGAWSDTGPLAYIARAVVCVLGQTRIR